MRSGQPRLCPPASSQPPQPFCANSPFFANIPPHAQPEPPKPQPTASASCYLPQEEFTLSTSVTAFQTAAACYYISAF